jgi:DNA N-6-adenine-methyltransferase (Dam)
MDRTTRSASPCSKSGRFELTIGSHQRAIGRSQSWISPRHIVDAVGPFDLDPCAASPRPWACAAENWSADGLERPWHGCTYLNPPFDRREVGRWISKLADHGNGIALLHVRTETAWFQPIWEQASGILFLADRLFFHYPDGRRAEANSGAPPCLVSFGAECRERLRRSGLRGRARARLEDPVTDTVNVHRHGLV